MSALRVIEPVEPIIVDVEGRPAPKGSRISGKTKSGKAYTYPASTYEKGWVEEVKHATQLVMRHRAPLPPPYAVRLTFRFAKAKRHKYPWPTSADLDKLARAVIDGLVKGGAMQDDRFVRALTAEKVFTLEGQEPGVIAEIASEQDIW